MPKIIRGPSIEIGEETFPLPDVISQFQESVDEDQTDPDEINELLVRRYAQATSEIRELLDDYTADLCGWTLKTLIQQAGAEDELLKALGIVSGQDAEPAQNSG
jgi:hypothetical protein